MHLSLDIFAKGCISELGKNGFTDPPEKRGSWIWMVTPDMHLFVALEMITGLPEKKKNEGRGFGPGTLKCNPLDSGWFEMLMDGSGSVHGFPVHPHPCCPLVDCCSPNRRISYR